MENLENDVKKPEILSDEQLKEVAGGKITNGRRIQLVKKNCAKVNYMSLCIQCSDCAWINNQCVPNPNKYDYDYKSEI